MKKRILLNILEGMIIGMSDYLEILVWRFWRKSFKFDENAILIKTEDTNEIVE